MPEDARHHKSALIEKTMQAIVQTDALLEGMQMFQQYSTLLAAGQHESAVKLLLHIFTVTELLGIPYQR